jgi:hypothetical protein
MLQITITKRGLPSSETLIQHARGALVQTAEAWRDGTMPRHFDRGAASKYGYEKRTTKYQNYKNRRGIGPLQYTGKARRMILNDKREPTGAATKITLRIKVPASFYRRYKGWSKVMADELTTILPAEVRQIGQQVQHVFVERVSGENRIEREVFRA